MRRGRFGALLLALAAAGCADLGQIGQLGQLIEGRRATVALESIDGPPPAVFHKFVRTLKEEAGARQITVVSSGEADYRLRGYLAAHSAGGKTSITWAWDVYGAGQRRAFRLSGEDAAGSAGPDGWAAADDHALRRIAQKGIEQLAAFMATAPRPAAGATAEAAPPPPSSPPRPASTFAWLDDWTPEANGIFRLLGRESQPEMAADAGADLPGAGAVPLPRRRPPATVVLALATSD